jgi:deoxyribodipyrimidine photo-lyase
LARRVSLHSGKEHVVFERSEALMQSGALHTVFTPCKNAWFKKLEPFHLEAFSIVKHAANLAVPRAGVAAHVPTLAEIGFEPTNLAA